MEPHDSDSRRSRSNTSDSYPNWFAYRAISSRLRDDNGRFTSRSRSRDDDDDRPGTSRGHGGWFGNREGHAEASRRGWETREALLVDHHVMTMTRARAREMKTIVAPHGRGMKIVVSPAHTRGMMTTGTVVPHAHEMTTMHIAIHDSLNAIDRIWRFADELPITMRGI
jgi:hypothetical protein